MGSFLNELTAGGQTEPYERMHADVTPWSQATNSGAAAGGDTGMATLELAVHTSVEST